MTEFSPSDLRHRLTLEQLSRVADEGGGFHRELGDSGHALERYEADRLAGRITHQVSLRYRAGVAPAMRFRKGTRIFHIVSAIDVEERKRWLTCLCEEREL